MKENSKRGAPVGNAFRKGKGSKHARFTLRLSELDQRLIAAAAKHTKLSQGEYVLQLVREAARKLPPLVQLEKQYGLGEQVVEEPPKVIDPFDGPLDDF